MKHFVYILECTDRTLYTGYTNNLEKRLAHHNGAKSGAHYTKIRRPVSLKYFEELSSQGKALSREAEIKKWTKEKKLKLISELVI